MVSLRPLWAGFGELLRVQTHGATTIVKVSRAPAGAGRSFGDRRKLRSYEVELAFYRDFAPRSPARIARCLGHHAEPERTLLVLEDLDASGFSERRDVSMTSAERTACLHWLADLHAAFLGEAPRALWDEGSYWHLATRSDELARTADRRLVAAAPVLDAKLATARHRTIVHGDAKEENFCFTADARVAAVDFQYAGGGVGVRDVAYLLTGLGEVDEERGLEAYFARLGSQLRQRGVDASAVVAEWRDLYPIAWLDFQRFLAGWAPHHPLRDEATERRISHLLAALA